MYRSVKGEGPEFSVRKNYLISQQNNNIDQTDDDATSSVQQEFDIGDIRVSYVYARVEAATVLA